MIQNVRRRRSFAAGLIPTSLFALASLMATGSPARGEPSLAGTAARAASDSPVLATFEGGSITVADLEDVIAKKIPASRPSASRPDGRKHVLDELVRFELLVLEAERRGYAKHPVVAEAVRREMVDTLTQEVIAVDPASIAKADVEAHFKANLAKYQRPAMRRARHVVFQTEAEARALIADLTSREVSAIGEISKLAKERAESTAAEQQAGELGFFDESGALLDGTGRVPLPLAKAAFQLKKIGEVAAEPAQTEKGFSVVVLVSQTAAAMRTLQDADSMVREAVAAERSKAAVDAVLEQQRAAHPVELHEGRVASIELAPAARGSIPQGFPAAPRDPRRPLQQKEPDGI